MKKKFIVLMIVVVLLLFVLLSFIFPEIPYAIGYLAGTIYKLFKDLFN